MRSDMIVVIRNKQKVVNRSICVEFDYAIVGKRFWSSTVLPAIPKKSKLLEASCQVLDIIFRRSLIDSYRFTIASDSLYTEFL